MTYAYRIKPALGYSSDVTSSPAIVEVNGTFTIESGATFAAEVSSQTENATLRIENSVNLMIEELKEDYTKYSSISIGGLNIPTTKAAYFYSSLNSTFKGTGAALAANTTYRYNGTSWE